ncbi:MAG: hypothetical protein PHG85_07290, partial [Candidatus Altiarchaeota archaeon]|nr:hypothetical protein [Candidatus Altiarchaeota archaeon]
GTNYNLPKSMGLKCPTEFLYGAQYDMDVECDRDMVELHFVVPYFFAWVIPLEDRARVGLCAKTNPTPHLDSFVRRLAGEKRLKSRRIMDRSFGIIPVYNPLLKTQLGSVRLVGDAAGQVKATTGGGVVMGGIAARNAWAGDYEKRWRRDIGSELELHLRLYRLIHRLSARSMDRLFRITANSSGSLARHGDMDYASKTLSSLLRNPRFVAEFLLSTPSFILDLF